MQNLYPEIEPYSHGMLAVGDGNSIYWEICGNPQGIPALVLHGGPGSGCSTNARRFFDPDRYRIILFDQRGCGRSTPHASDADADMSVNTTAHLLADIECLRQYLDASCWLVFGMSWGCTLGLAYAEKHPDRVLALVLAGVTTTRRSEIDWLYRGIAPLFPEQWVKFRAGTSGAGFDITTMREGDELIEERDGDLVSAYYHLLNNADPNVRLKAARDWHEWEAASILINPAATPSSKWSDDRYILARARIITHYFHHNAWLENGVLLREASALNGISGIMVQGRFDLEAPLVTAWELSQVWPDSELVIVPNAGHSPTDTGMSEAIVAATDRFAHTLRM
ncbi:prolyl aminopeptidase [Phyllobacterium meliloti]|uniref:prolyl aminopeptidase n=1 Tax=Phyllobacterium meliloti TaxID=555317 RepID=UPI001D156D33|nr:prolyl aminopeptidase [Phyllobacterium sp. T1293]UGX88856.1 prolyl aminopeptidase [Phyllobacterium sp. T1293]